MEGGEFFCVLQILPFRHLTLSQSTRSPVSHSSRTSKPPGAKTNYTEPLVPTVRVPSLVRRTLREPLSCGP